MDISESIKTDLSAIIPRSCLFLFAFVISFHSSAQTDSFQLDTSCIPVETSLFGGENFAPDKLIHLKEKTNEAIEEDDEQSQPERIRGCSIDTIADTGFGTPGQNQGFYLNRDSSLVTWMVPGFSINRKIYPTKIIEDEGPYYYEGFLEPVQLYWITSVGGRNEIGFLDAVDKASGRTITFESPSDYPLESPALSPSLKYLSMYANDYYTNTVYISIFEIRKNENKFCLVPHSGFQLDNRQVNNLVWPNDHQFAISISPFIREPKSSETLLITLDPEH